MRHIRARYARQRRVQFHAKHGAKWMLRSQQHGAAHTCPYVDKRIFVERSYGAASPPPRQYRVKNRRRNSVVGGRMPIVAVPGLQMAPRNQAAGANTMFNVERVPNQTIAHGQPREESRPGLTVQLDSFSSLPAHP
jgi:hypothetical protein